MLILVDTKANSNKFYKLELDATGRVSKTYGRVGATGVTNYEMTGSYGFDIILHAKKRKGYREVDVAGDTPAQTGARVDNARLHAVAKSGLTTGKASENADIARLIERIVRVNAHQILESSGGLMKVDTSGRIQTPLGIVTGRSIDQADKLLSQMSVSPASALPSLLEQYLTFVPQKVGSRAGWADTFFNAENTIQKQKDFLQQLRDSLNFYDAQAAAAATSPEDTAADAGFKYRLRPVAKTGAVFKRIEALYASTKNGMHTSSSLNLVRVFELVDTVGAAKYKTIASEIGNEQQLWHGTKAANLLSILRRGLYVQPTSGSTIQIAGRMFGDGIYLSRDSTKSLNYSQGYWTAGARDNNCFMLLNDVAMGSEYRPTRGGFDPAIPREARNTLNKFGKPWNSINVKAGSGGVRNAESIVWNTDQIRARYLCEFDR